MTNTLNIGQSELAAVQFYDGAPDGDGNPTGSEIILDHAATWGSSPSGKITITPLTNQSATLTGVVADADVTITATDTSSGIFATIHITVPAEDVPIPPDPSPPDPDPDIDLVTNPPTPTGGTGSDEDTQNDEWWGPQDPLIPIFPLHPSLGYTPVVPAPSNPPPLFAQWGFDNGFIGYIRNS